MLSRSDYAQKFLHLFQFLDDISQAARSADRFDEAGLGPGIYLLPYVRVRLPSLSGPYALLCRVAGGATNGEATMVYAPHPSSQR